MQRDHSRSDSKQQRLHWELISEDENLQPPKKKRKLHEADHPHQEELDQSQNSTPRRSGNEAEEEEQIVVSEGEFS